MSHYIHHVPGRLRVCSKRFRCNASRVRLLEDQLREIQGVRDVRYNTHSGSLIIQYDPATDAARRVEAILPEARRAPLAKPAAGGGKPELVTTFTRALVSALAQQVVSRSFSRLSLILR